VGGRGGCGGLRAVAPPVLLASRTVADFEPSAALAAAAKGDQQAWDAIVNRYTELVWAVARGFRLNPADASDVTQATWLRLVEHLTDIRDGDRLGAWLATTARREALGLIRRGRRDIPVEDAGLAQPDAIDGESPEEHILRAEQDTLLWQAFRRLGGPCQRLLRVLLVDPPPAYAEVGAALGMPVGSIGPTRARCLSMLRALLKGVT
jgi:RNA polymerase sigma factor (sigma-70 family)